MNENASSGEEAGCWNCGSDDHYKRDCPQLPSRPRDHCPNRSSEKPQVCVVSKQGEGSTSDSLFCPEPESDRCYESEDVSTREVYSPPPASHRLRSLVPDSNDETDCEVLYAKLLFITNPIHGCNTLLVSDGPQELQCRKAGISAWSWMTTQKIDRPGRD
jgi:hypothetical protein